MPLERLTNFDWPVSQHRMSEFPDVADAMLAMLLAWWLRRPAQWGATLSLAVVIHGLGMAVMMRPVWTDMRFGLRDAVLAIGAALLLVSEELRAIYDSQASRQANCAGENCPDLYNAVLLVNVHRRELEPRRGLLLSGTIAPSWSLLLRCCSISGAGSLLPCCCSSAASW